MFSITFVTTIVYLATLGIPKWILWIIVGLLLFMEVNLFLMILKLKRLQEARKVL